MEELSLRIPSQDMAFISELAARMGWVLNKLSSITNITLVNDVAANEPQKNKIKLPKGNGKSSQEAMEWVKSLVIKGGNPVPVEENGRELRSEKYL